MFCSTSKDRVRWLSLLVLLLWGELLHSQCTGGVTNRGVLSPTLLVWQTTAANVISGDYFTFAAAANTPYTFTFCLGGGTANYNTHITILDAATGLVVQDFNDDACGGGRSMISHFWTPGGGTYRVLIRRTGCAGPVGGDAATMAYRQESPLPSTGNTCANAYVIPALPFTATGIWTCGMGNEYNSSHACLSTFMNGDDFVFSFTTSAARCINITVTGNYTYSAVFLLNGCPDAGGTTCVAKHEVFGAGPPTLTGVSIPAGTYYIVVDKSNIPDCTPFSILVQDCPAVGGNNCTNAAIIPSLPYVQGGFTTAGYGNDYTHTDKCLSDYMRGEDFVFRYDATGPTCIDVFVSGTNNYTGVHVLDGCPNMGPTNCIAWEGSPSNNPHLRNVSLPSAGDYYIIVDTWAPTTATTPFSITVQNCVERILTFLCSQSSAICNLFCKIFKAHLAPLIWIAPQSFSASRGHVRKRCFLDEIVRRVSATSCAANP